MTDWRWACVDGKGLPPRLLGGELLLDGLVERHHGGVPQCRVDVIVRPTDGDVALKPVDALFAGPDDLQDFLGLHGVDCGDADSHGAGVVIGGVAKHDVVLGNQGRGNFCALVGFDHGRLLSIGSVNFI